MRFTAFALLVVAFAVVACGGPQRPRFTHGSVLGIVSDSKSGEPIAMAEVILRAPEGSEVRVLSNTGGLYDVDNVVPGRYEIRATYAGQPLRVRNVVIEAGRATYVDLLFELGAVAPIDIDFGDPAWGRITRFAPKTSNGTGVIQGTVSASGTKERIAGAVVTARGNLVDVLQTVTDDHGAYRFADLPPDAYSISAYYAMGGRSQIEVQRNAVTVAAGEGVRVPLIIELSEGAAED